MTRCPAKYRKLYPHAGSDTQEYAAITFRSRLISRIKLLTEYLLFRDKVLVTKVLFVVVDADIPPNQPTIRISVV